MLLAGAAAGARASARTGRAHAATITQPARPRRRTTIAPLMRSRSAPPCSRSSFRLVPRRPAGIARRARRAAAAAVVHGVVRYGPTPATAGSASTAGGAARLPVERSSRATSRDACGLLRGRRRRRLLVHDVGRRDAPPSSPHAPRWRRRADSDQRHSMSSRCSSPGGAEVFTIRDGDPAARGRRVSTSSTPSCAASGRRSAGRAPRCPLLVVLGPRRHHRVELLPRRAAGEVGALRARAARRAARAPHHHRHRRARRGHRPPRGGPLRDGPADHQLVAGRDAPVQRAHRPGARVGGGRATVVRRQPYAAIRPYQDTIGVERRRGSSLHDHDPSGRAACARHRRGRTASPTCCGTSPTALKLPTRDHDGVALGPE